MKSYKIRVRQVHALVADLCIADLAIWQRLTLSGSADYSGPDQPARILGSPERMAEAGRILGIPVLDQLIVTGKGFRRL